jgi:hypothetical protein
MIAISITAALNALLISSSVIEFHLPWIFQQIFIIISNRSIRIDLYSLTSSSIPQNSYNIKVAPCVSSCHTIASFFTKSTIPLKSFSSPIIKWLQQHLILHVSNLLKPSKVRTLTIHFIHERGTLYWSASLQFVSDCGSTPSTALNKKTNPSSTRKERFTLQKSTCPEYHIKVIWQSW